MRLSIDGGGERDSLLRRAAQSEEISIEVTLQGRDWLAEYGFAFAGNAQGEEELKSEHLSLNGSDTLVRSGQLVKADALSLNEKPSQKSLLLPTLAKSAPNVEAVYDFLLNMNFYDLKPDSFRQPQKMHNPFPLLENGANLASALHELHSRGEDYLITDALEVAVEGIDGYQVELVGQQLVTKLHYTFQNGTSYQAYSNLRDEADGTLQLLGVLTALYQLRYRSVLAIEEPEKTIYSRDVGILSDVFQEAALSSQVLVTTHNRDLIDDLPINSFLVVEKEDGHTKIGPIIHEQQEAVREELFSLGELMLIEGLYREGASLIAKV